MYMTIDIFGPDRTEVGKIFTKIVEEYIIMGWKCQGGVSVSCWLANPSWDVPTTMHGYTQAMVEEG